MATGRMKSRNGSSRPSEETMGAILEWMNRADQDRSEVKADMDRVTSELSGIRASIERQFGTLAQIEKRTEILDGDKGLANRVFMAESQIRSHDEKLTEHGTFIDGAQKLMWKIVGAAILASALSGSAASKIVAWAFK